MLVGKRSLTHVGLNPNPNHEKADESIRGENQGLAGHENHELSRYGPS